MLCRGDVVIISLFHKDVGKQLCGGCVVLSKLEIIIMSDTC